jgi:lipopolysaccharide/colanic/teichoic acid biosynthesis glycosyltransferase
MAGVGLILAAPALALSAVLIKVGSVGPVFFRQKRVGLYGKEFTLLKLRTMAVTQDGPKMTASNDARITPIGRILRKTKIDELPGLWNVLRGDMSFVGPRPEVPELVDLNDPRWKEILTALPGITDPVTLRLRNEESLLESVADKERFYREILQPFKLRGYVDFVRGKSWRSDIRIIFQTLRAIIFPNTAVPPTAAEMGWPAAEQNPSV